MYFASDKLAELKKKLKEFPDFNKLKYRSLKYQCNFKKRTFTQTYPLWAILNFGYMFLLWIVILTCQVVFGYFRPIIFTMFGKPTKALSGKNYVLMQDFLLITMGNPIPGSFPGNGVFC